MLAVGEDQYQSPHTTLHDIHSQLISEDYSVNSHSNCIAVLVVLSQLGQANLILCFSSILEVGGQLFSLFIVD